MKLFTERLMKQHKTTGLPEFLEDDHKVEYDSWSSRWTRPEEKEKEKVKR